MAVALIIFISNINAFNKGLYQRHKHIGYGVLGILSEGQQPFLNFLNVPDGIHLTTLAVL